MAQVLYRKYRSKNFSEIFGQDSIKQVLQQAIEDNAVAHAYLFTGPRGTGKTSMARILAKALNCKDKKGSDPCNKCSICQAINDSRFLDLVEIDAASNRGIDEIRDLKEKVGFLPVEGTYKVYIIDEVHMLTSEAFNALLKTLEEPPNNVIFILATTEAHKLPPTIISRTQRFDFKPADSIQLKAKLSFILEREKLALSDEALELVVANAGGSYRDAETILEKIIVSMGVSNKKVIQVGDVSGILGLANSKFVEKFFAALYEKDSENAFAVVKEVQSEGVDLGQYIKQLLLKARQELIETVVDKDGKYDLAFLYALIKELTEASERIKNNPVPTLVLEMAILSIVGILPEKTNDNGRLKKTKPINNDPKTLAPESPVETRIDKNLEKEGVENGPVAEQSELDFNEVIDKWGDFITLAKEKNPHFAALLVKLVLKGVQSSVVEVEVPFKFHQKQLENSKTRKVFSEMTETVYGTALSLDVVLNESLVVVEKEQEGSSNNSNTTIVEEVFGDML